MAVVASVSQYIAKGHVSIYPVTAAVVARYGKAIAPYRAGRGTPRFPLDRPIPVGLVAKLAKVRVKERRGNAKGPAVRRALRLRDRTAVLRTSAGRRSSAP